MPEGFEKSVAVVGVTGTFGDYVFKSYGLVRVVKSSTLAMIQTDMYEYKPSQKVSDREGCAPNKIFADLTRSKYDFL